jgi:hypothetical protein
MAPGRRLSAIVLNKAIVYLDLASLRDRGATVTHNAHVAIQQGPVGAKYPRRLVAQLESRGYAKHLSEWDGSAAGDSSSHCPGRLGQPVRRRPPGAWV